MPHLNKTLHRRGFTLVELLIVMSIIAVLSSMAIGIIGSAQEDAREAATRSRIGIVRKILEIELEDYEVRRSPVSFFAISTLTQAVPEPRWAGSANSGDTAFLLHAKNLKRMIVADLIRAEMPTGKEGPTPHVTATVDNSLINKLGRFPSGNLRRYLRDLGLTDAQINSAFFNRRTAAARRWDAFAGFANTTDDSDLQRLADSAELLYAILSDIDYNGTRGIDAIGSQAIGDSDGDGVLEVVDAWGEPIGFELHQPNIVEAPTAPPSHGVWAEPGIWNPANPQPPMTSLNVREDTATNAQKIATIKPARVDQIRFYITSLKLLEIDGSPRDFQSID